MNDASVALQLYTVRDQAAQDFKGTLQRVAQLGYKHVEFAGYGGLTANELTAVLAENGLSAISTHVSFSALEQDTEREIHYCLEIGSPYIVLPWISEEWRTAEALPRLAEHFNTFGRRAHEHGLTFGYHNHDFEFKQPVDGKYWHEQLLDATDPALVAFELDTFWVAYAGADPVAYLRKHAGRIPLVHLKDMTSDRKFTEVGDGILPTKEIITVAQESGAVWYIVENDSPAIASLDSAARSLENLRKL